MYDLYGQRLSDLVAAKQQQYGDSIARSAHMLHALYPEGVPPHAYGDLLLVVRMLDKLARIAARGEDGRNRGGESPYTDLAGYALRGWVKDETATELPSPCKEAADDLGASRG